MRSSTPLRGGQSKVRFSKESVAQQKQGSVSAIAVEPIAGSFAAACHGHEQSQLLTSGQGISASQLLAAELASAQAKLTASATHLQLAQRSAAAQRKRFHDEVQELWLPGRARKEEAVASSCANAQNSQSLARALAETTRRQELVEAATSTELYWKWKRAFEAHLRSGGSFEDFQMDDFLKDSYGIVTFQDLEGAEKAAEEINRELQDVQDKVSAAQEEASKLLLERSAIAEENRRLSQEAKSEETANSAWSEDSLKAGPRLLQLREELGQHQSSIEELEIESRTLEDEMSSADLMTKRLREEVAALRAQLLPCKQTAVMLEERAAESAGRGEQVLKKVEMQEFELGRHKLVHVMGREARQAGRSIAAHQQQALALLRQAAADRSAEKASEMELQQLWENIQERHREATALRSACRHTKGLREAAERDLQGLQESHGELLQKKHQTLQFLSLAETAAKASISPRLYERLGSRSIPVAFDASPLSHLSSMRTQDLLNLPVPFAGSGQPFTMGPRPQPLSREVDIAAPAQRDRNYRNAAAL